jgi:hypothetical protein
MKTIVSIMLFCVTSLQVMAMHPLREAIVKEQNREVAILIFRSYSPEQRAIVWRDKMDQTLTAKAWNDEELYLIKMMQSQIKAELFTDGSEEHAHFNSYYKEFEAQGLMVFDKVTYAKIFIIPDDYNDANAPTAGGGGGGGQPDCTCNIGGIFTCDWISGVDECGKSACLVSAWGCGGLWAQDCNGDCFVNAWKPTNPNNGGLDPLAPRNPNIIVK